MMARTSSVELEPVAAVVQRLAVLLAAGVAPASAWQYLADAGGPQSRRLKNIVRALGAGTTISDAIVATVQTEAVRRRAAPALRRRPGPDAPDAAAWRGLAAGWFVATSAGAPLASSLRDFAAGLRDLAQTERDLATALAGPVATAKLVMVLPAVGILFGVVLGFNSLAALFSSVPGFICLGTGTALLLAARAWNHGLLARARPAIRTPGLAMDLMAIAVSGGASLARANEVVAQARERCGIQADGVDSIAEVLELSRRAGVPAAALLRSAADEARRQARSSGEQKAATLAVTLMLPLGLCVLPAFMLLSVAPLLIAILSSTVAVL
ncbi:MAG: type II secretion system F family protein [Terrimesophilobacter sp.]